MLPLSELNPNGSSDFKQELNATVERIAIKNSFIFMFVNFYVGGDAN